MDGTHFPHHPRTAHLKAAMADEIGSPRSVASAFQFNLADRKTIRYNPALEPYGVIGDAGWYKMRAVVEYLSPDVELVSADAYLGQAEDGSGSYMLRRGGWGLDAVRCTVSVPSDKPGAALMFDDFAKMTGDPAWIERSIRATERTQSWLDAAWQSALEREAGK